MVKSGEQAPKKYDGPTHTCNIGLVMSQESQAKLDKMFRCATVLKNCFVHKMNGILDRYVHHSGYKQYAIISKQIEEEKAKKGSDRYNELNTQRIDAINLAHQESGFTGKFDFINSVSNEYPFSYFEHRIPKQIHNYLAGIVFKNAKLRVSKKHDKFGKKRLRKHRRQNPLLSITSGNIQAIRFAKDKDEVWWLEIGGRTIPKISIKAVVDMSDAVIAHAFNNKISSVKLMRKWGGTGWKYYAQVTVQCESLNKQRKKGIGVIGLDTGPSKFAYYMNEEKYGIIDISAFTPSVDDKIAKLDKTISKMGGGKNCAKKRGARITLFERRTKTRDSMMKAEAWKLRAFCDTIITEKMEWKGMHKKKVGKSRTKKQKRGGVKTSRGPSFSKSIQKYAPGRFSSIIKEIFEKSGGKFIEVNTKKISATGVCPVCLKYTKHALDKREFDCQYCGFHHEDRDIKAAIVLASIDTKKLTIDTDLLSRNFGNVSRCVNSYQSSRDEQVLETSRVPSDGCGVVASNKTARCTEGMSVRASAVVQTPLTASISEFARGPVAHKTPVALEAQNRAFF